MDLLPRTKDFFRSGLSGDDSRKVLPDLIGAAEQHILWKIRMGHHVRGGIREPMESALIGQDGICQLGVWINGRGSGHLRDTEVYAALHAAHRRFHEMGDAIVRKLQVGDRDGAEVLFNGEYSLAMTNIIMALTEINKSMRQA